MSAGRDPALSGAQRAAFILANTRLLSPPLVPEVRLHLAAESLPIWRKTEDELGREGLPPPYWAFAWAGGQALARYMLDHADVVRGRQVLDLGAGSGIAAIAAMKAGAAAALAADIDGFAQVAMGLNAATNGVGLATTTNDLLSEGGAEASAAQLLLVGDLFYERPLADAVLKFIERAAAAGATVLVGDPRRSYFPASRFVPVAEYQVPVSRELEDAEIKRAAVWRLAG